MYFMANISFFGMRNDHNRQVKRLWQSRIIFHVLGLCLQGHMKPSYNVDFGWFLAFWASSLSIFNGKKVSPESERTENVFSDIRVLSIEIYVLSL